MTDDIIARLREAYAASTQGEWEFIFQCVSGVESFQSGWKATNHDGVTTPVKDVIATTYDVDDTPFPQAEENGRFIALSHNHMPAILAVLEAAEAMADVDDITASERVDLVEAVRALREAK